MPAHEHQHHGRQPEGNIGKQHAADLHAGPSRGVVHTTVRRGAGVMHAAHGHGHQNGRSGALELILRIESQL